MQYENAREREEKLTIKIRKSSERRDLIQERIKRQRNERERKRHSVSEAHNLLRFERRTSEGESE